VIGCGLAQLVFAAAWYAGCDGMFQVAIETLIRVQLGRVTGQIEDFDLLDMLRQLLFDRRAVMNPKVIQH